MPPNPLYAECIQRAAALLGGCAALAARLGVPQRLVERWLDGRCAVPEGAFLRAVDILLEKNVPPETGREADRRPL